MLPLTKLNGKVEAGCVRGESIDRSDGATAGERPHRAAEPLTGDRAVYARLHARYASALISYAVRLTGRPDVAEDLVADVFVAAMVRRAPETVAEGALRSWLYRCTSNAAARWMRRERVRRRARERLVGMSGVVGSEPASADDIARNVYLALPAHEREAIALHVGCGMRIEHAAAALGVSEGTLRSRLSRARARMRRLAALAEGSS